MAPGVGPLHLPGPRALGTAGTWGDSGPSSSARAPRSLAAWDSSPGSSPSCPHSPGASLPSRRQRPALAPRPWASERARAQQPGARGRWWGRNRFPGRAVRSAGPQLPAPGPARGSPQALQLDSDPGSEPSELKRASGEGERASATARLENGRGAAARQVKRGRSVSAGARGSAESRPLGHLWESRRGLAQWQPLCRPTRASPLAHPRTPAPPTPPGCSVQKEPSLENPEETRRFVRLRAAQKESDEGEAGKQWSSPSPAHPTPAPLGRGCRDPRTPEADVKVFKLSPTYTFGEREFCPFSLLARTALLVLSLLASQTPSPAQPFHAKLPRCGIYARGGLAVPLSPPQQAGAGGAGFWERRQDPPAASFGNRVAKVVGVKDEG